MSSGRKEFALWTAMAAVALLLLVGILRMQHSTTQNRWATVVATKPAEGNAVFRELRDLGIPVCVAGAGPSLLAFESDDAELPEPGADWRLLRLAPRRMGAEVR